mmetsp:Transcript_7966/g.25347  ORF Transcript_7966/g.25347 Transcript_7966/m.25347 type:complete len:119 (-) Transcript_7966:493-849(-)
MFLGLTAWLIDWLAGCLSASLMSWLVGDAESGTQTVSTCHCHGQMPGRARKVSAYAYTQGDTGQATPVSSQYGLEGSLRKHVGHEDFAEEVWEVGRVENHKPAARRQLAADALSFFSK